MGRRVVVHVLAVCEIAEEDIDVPAAVEGLMEDEQLYANFRPVGRILKVKAVELPETQS